MFHLRKGTFIGEVHVHVPFTVMGVKEALNGENTFCAFNIKAQKHARFHVDFPISAYFTPPPPPYIIMVTTQSNRSRCPPTHLWHVVAGVEPGTLGVDPGELAHVVLDEVFGGRFDEVVALLLHEGRLVEGAVQP